MTISEQLEKEKAITKEKNKIKKLYKDFPKEKVKVLEGLINESAFMKVSIEELRVDLIKEGLSEIFKQGKQEFKREHPQVRTYVTFLKQYSAVMKQLIDLLPPELKKEETDALMEFIKRGQIKK
ncbi:hypothetical protein HZI73_22400 [Vallitalea pronyensis]|uniref:Uncharacterized protein n=1 Tax=Vallitalea pronyensis TaxID=1348613 RepID=A0A8J8SIW9_9FIRM|nr:hypothetical protein [Vallitalea pronyensis]QUI24882.1 hypothetical protein HZI73_22400 [Vallitalea pronyensis]